MEIAIILLVIALVGMVVLFIRERWAREDERKAFVAQRKELRAMVNTMIGKEAAALDRWKSMYSAYKAGWNDAVMAMAEADVAEAKAKAKAKINRHTMK